ncbi:MAG: MFS transporter [Intrasporangium sp.]|uniref:MFS transporter n=1 Tax=Intrasporangium sp. TaxID=1925024 RepID=UPI00264A3EF0|nr:MFS transporter [Intrasporangium sp.]MDN5796763.1 MFS transporter [Intrasporangium sp.]
MYLADRSKPAVKDSPRRGARRRVASTVVALGTVSLLTDISSESLSAVLPLYLTVVLGLSPLAYGVVDGIYQGASALVRILGGWLSDRTDRPKWVAFIGYALSAATKLVLIPAHGFAAISAIVSVDRLGKGLRTAPRDALIATASDEATLGRSFGIHRALDTVGAAIGPLLAFGILWVVPGDYRSVFVASFAAALVGLVVLGLLVPDLRPRRDSARAAGQGSDPDAAVSSVSSASPVPAPAPSVPKPSLRLMLRSPGLRRLVVAAAILGVLTVSDGFLYLSLQQRDSFAAQYFPLLFVGTNIAYFSLAVPLGHLSDRVGRPHVLVLGHVLLVAAYLCAAGPAGGLGTTILCLLFLGAFYAATDGVLAALTSTLVPTASRAVGIATTQTVVAISRFASSLLFGLLWVRVGRAPAVWVFAVTLFVAVPVAWALVRNLRPAVQA